MSRLLGDLKKLRDKAGQVLRNSGPVPPEEPIKLLLDPIRYDVPGAEDAARHVLDAGVRPRSEHLLKGGSR